MESLPFCFLSWRYDGYNDPKKYIATINCLKNKNKNGRLSICVNMQFKYGVTISNRNSAKLSGASQ